MFRFGDPSMFYLMLLVPLLVVMYVLAQRARARRIRRFGDPETVSQLMPDTSPRRVRTKFIIFTLAVALIVVALARPQVGSKMREESHTGIEMMFVVDVSNSMLADDFPPSRLERTVGAVTRLLAELKGNRVGLVVFAGEAYVQLPMTPDLESARSFASRISTDMLSRQGTAIGAAIDLAANSFSSESEGSRVMVIISDGENHEDDALGSAEAAARRGITIYTIGIGTPEGTVINIGGDMIRDTEGNPVVTRLDETVLRQIALATGGTYVRATPGNLGLQEIMAKIGETRKTRLVETVFEEYDELYRYPLYAALALLLLEALMLSRRNHILARLNIFGKAPAGMRES